MRHLVNLALFEALVALTVALVWAADPSSFEQGLEGAARWGNYAGEIALFNLYVLPLCALYLALLGWVVRRSDRPRRAAFLWAVVAFVPLVALGVTAPFSAGDREFVSYVLVPIGMGMLVRLPAA